MARKFLSLRQTDLDRLYDRAVNNPATTAIDRRAYRKAIEEDKKKSNLALAMRRLKTAFGTRATSVSRRQAIKDHSQPESDHPNIVEWKQRLAASDFVAFVCDCLKIETADYDARMMVAKWLDDLRASGMVKIRVTGDTYETFPYIAIMFEACIDAAVDEWQQDKRAGKPRADEQFKRLGPIADDMHASVHWNSDKRKSLKGNKLQL